MTTIGDKDSLDNLKIALLNAGISNELLEDYVSEINALYTDKNQIEEVLLRINSGEPIQYIVGHQPFYKEDYIVNSNVLIPRPDTELLVEAVSKFCGACDFPMGDINLIPKGDMNKGDQLTFADFCTGSGCVGISVINQLALKGYDVVSYLTDISSEALKVCNLNLKSQLSEISKEVSSVKVINCDLMNKDKMLRLIPNEGLDFICSNPPYITSKDMEELDKSVSDYEPDIALFGGTDGLDFYKILALYGKVFLKSHGAIIMEHGYDQGEAVRNIFIENGYRDVKTLKDYGGNDRVCFAVKG